MASDEKNMIDRAVARAGFSVSEWREDPEDGLTGVVGRFVVVTDDDDNGLYSGDEGELAACLVGAAQYDNQRVAWQFTADGYDGACDVSDLDLLEPVA